MRYVGRHRATRPLLLRRPILGGTAVVVLLAIPATLAATGTNPLGGGTAATSSRAKTATAGANNGEAFLAPADQTPTSVAGTISVATSHPASPTTASGGGSNYVPPRARTTTRTTTSSSTSKATKPKPTTSKPSATKSSPSPSSTPSEDPTTASPSVSSATLGAG